MSRTCATTVEGTARPASPEAPRERHPRGPNLAREDPGTRARRPWTRALRLGSVPCSMPSAVRTRSAHPANGAGAAWARQAMALLLAPTQKTP